MVGLSKPMWQRKGVSVDAGGGFSIPTKDVGQCFVQEMRAQITELCAIQDQVRAPTAQPVPVDRSV